MSLERQENQGTGLGDVFDLLVKAPSERLQSLTFQLGESPEDNIILALCLIILQREVEALNKLQMLMDSSLAKHVAEKWQMSEGKLEDFGIQCGRFEALTGASLTELARVFRVLSEQRLCDPLLRNLAYKRALSSDCLKPSNGNDLEYNKFKEEAKDVCGPEFAEWMCSPTDLKSESCPSLHKSVSQDLSQGTRSFPSPLHANHSVPSYPSHLEISMPSTVLFQGEKISLGTSGSSKLGEPILVREKEPQNVSKPSQLSEPQPKSTRSLPSEAKKDSKMDKISAAASSIVDSHMSQANILDQTKKTSSEHSARNISPPKISAPKEMYESKGAEEEEEDPFYGFVILHAPEDADMADSMKERLEAVIGGEVEGATFSDFAIPGKSTLKCVEDAINNSAFTLLLLTRNFNTRLLDLKTNTALINSIHKEHKYNTVIPLLPRENCMPRQDIPIVLQTMVPLDEKKNFDKKIQKSMSPAKIEKQRRIWMKEKIQKQRQKYSNNVGNLNILVENSLLLRPPEEDGGDQRALWKQQPNIHIENAKYIMIGNDSRMNVDLGGSASKDDSD